MLKSLLRWFDREKRDLPWRKTRDPYRIWVSEIMLQQTTVGTVLARYERFLARFPDIESLARAREDTVLAQWSGLGYYSRARNLHRAAKRIAALHRGRLPTEIESLRKLPGIGPYTAAAIAAIAFGRHTLPMDANIRRIVSRLFATADPSAFLPRLIGKSRTGDSVAALFDLGQTVCRPRDPRCTICPLGRGCRARREGRTAEFPAKKDLAPYRSVFVCTAAIERKKKYWLRRRRSAWLSGLWEFPAVEAPSRRGARTRFRRLFGPAILVGDLNHTIVRRRLRIEVYKAGSASTEQDGRWMTMRQIREGASPTLTKKIARLLSQRSRRAYN